MTAHLQGCSAHTTASFRPHHLGMTQPIPSTLISVSCQPHHTPSPSTCVRDSGLRCCHMHATSLRRASKLRATAQGSYGTKPSARALSRPDDLGGTGLQPHSAHGSDPSPVRDGSPRSLEESIVINFGHLQAFCVLAPASIPPLRCIGRRGW